MANNVYIRDLPPKPIPDSADLIEIQQSGPLIGSSKNITVGSIVKAAAATGIIKIQSGLNVSIDSSNPQQPIITVPTIGVTRVIGGSNTSIGGTKENPIINVTGFLTSITGGESITATETSTDVFTISLNTNILTKSNKIITIAESASNSVGFANNASGNISIGNNRLSGSLTIGSGGQSDVNIGNNMTGGSLTIGQGLKGNFRLYNYLWPRADGTDGQALVTNGNNSLSWQTIKSGSDGVKSVTGSNEIIISGTKTDPVISLFNTLYRNSKVPIFIANGSNQSIEIGNSGSGQIQIGTNRTNSTINIGSNTTGDVNIGNDLKGGSIVIGRNLKDNFEMYGYLWPRNDGKNGQVLTTNGSKILSFKDSAGGLPNPMPNNYYLQGEATDSSLRVLIGVNTGDQTFIASADHQTIIASNNFPLWAAPKGESFEFITSKGGQEIGGDLKLGSGTIILESPKDGLALQAQNVDKSPLLASLKNARVAGALSISNNGIVSLDIQDSRDSDYSSFITSKSRNSTDILIDKQVRVSATSGGVAVTGGVFNINGVDYKFPNQIPIEGNVLTARQNKVVSWDRPTIAKSPKTFRELNGDPLGLGTITFSNIEDANVMLILDQGNGQLKRLTLKDDQWIVSQTISIPATQKNQNSVRLSRTAALINIDVDKWQAYSLVFANNQYKPDGDAITLTGTLSLAAIGDNSFLQHTLAGIQLWEQSGSQWTKTGNTTDVLASAGSSFHVINTNLIIHVNGIDSQSLATPWKFDGTDWKPAGSAQRVGATFNGANSSAQINPNNIYSISKTAVATEWFYSASVLAKVSDVIIDESISFQYPFTCISILNDRAVITTDIGLNRNPIFQIVPEAYQILDDDVYLENLDVLKKLTVSEETELKSLDITIGVIKYKFPVINSKGVLTNDGAGNLTWA